MRSNLVIVVAVIPREPISDSVRPFQLFSPSVPVAYNNNTFVSLVGKMVSTSVEEPESVHIKLICGVGPKVPVPR